MAPKIKKCSLCRTNSTIRWNILNRKMLCAGCYDMQCNPPLEPKQARSNDTEAGPSSDRNGETFLESSLPVKSNPEDDAIFVKPTSAPPKPKMARQLSNTADNHAHPSSSKAQQGHSKAKAVGRTMARKLPASPKLSDQEKRLKAVNKVVHEGFSYEVGDVVSLVDTKDNTYYAQIRGIVVDVFNEKSVSLTWLIPSAESPPANESFDPASYQIGPEDEEMRDLRQIQFVMHAPNNYYFNRQHPVPRKTVTGPVHRDVRST